MPDPKISIITVSYNAEPYIERTIKSVIQQTYRPVEYLVIDGNSKDGTSDIIRKYESSIDYWVSEPDKSHFDAMNKGIEKCNGDYILILNSGDKLKDENSLTHIMKGSNQADFIYGRAEYIDEYGNTRPWHKKTPSARELSRKSFMNGMVICHQCMIVKKSLAPRFRLSPWKVSNDIEWAIRVMDNIKTIHFWDGTFCQYLEGGISNKQKWKAVRERFDISVFHFGLFPTILEQFKIILQLIKRKFL